MRKAVIVLGLVYAAALSFSLSAQQPQRDGPRYQDGTSLVRPTDYREWPFLGSGLGLVYEGETPRPPDSPTFTNVFVNPSSYRAFMQTGIWPNETRVRSRIQALADQRGAEPRRPFSRRVDGPRSASEGCPVSDGWGFFLFGQAAALRDVASRSRAKPSRGAWSAIRSTPPWSGRSSSSIRRCLEVARQKGTLKPGF